MGKGLALLGAALLLAALLILGYSRLPEQLLSIDDRLRDFLFTMRGPIAPTGDVVIVDIDEGSLQRFGQWPWSRNVVALLLQQLTDAGAGIIGLDIVFAEADKSSPARIASDLGVAPGDLADFDAILAQTIMQTPTIGGYFFSFEFNNSIAPAIPASFIEQGVVSDYIATATGARLNIPVIQDAFYSSGFFNNTPDVGGMVRHVPLVMRFDGILYPSLPMEMIRIFTETEVVRVASTEFGVEWIEMNDLKVPTERFGRLTINYRGPKGTFLYISAADVIDGTIDPAAVEGKFVLVGTSAVGLLDLRSTPFDEYMPGVEIHATAIDEIIRGDFIVRPNDAEAIDLLIIAVTVFAVMLLFSVISEYLILPVLLIWGVGLFYLYRHLLFAEGIALNLLFPLIALVASAMMTLFIRFMFELNQKRKLLRAFSKKVSPAVMNDIMANDTEALLSPRDKEVTIFFSDIRSFTSISETLGDPRRLIELLNVYMTPMVDIIVEQKGTIDKFIGDAVMAYWNAPLDLPGHADFAVQSALRQLEEVETLNAEIRKRFDVTLRIGIGINTGVTTIGEMGSAGRSDYTIIGDHVNLASRLEGLCKPYGVKLVISEFTKAALQGRYVIRELDKVRVKGKELPVRIFEVLAGGEVPAPLQTELDAYDEALAHYRGGRFEEALAAFEALEASSSHTLYGLYRDRCRYLLEHRPENFDGVFTFTTK